VLREVSSVQKKALSGDVDTLMSCPLSMMIPLGATYLGGFAAKKIQISDNYIDYGFSPDSFKKFI
jgi:hypothetical protein